MISLLQSDTQAEREPSPVQVERETEEFEVVLGRRQLAGVGLVAVVVLAVFSGVSYLIGKTAESKVAPPADAPTIHVPEPSAAQAVEPSAPTPQPAQPVVTPVAGVEASGGPLFADPIPGAVYIQVGAVEKGVAQIWAEGLRTHGMKAFVAPGLSDRIFRVLIGPLPSPDAYQYAKDALDRIGLETFGRKYQP